MSLRWLPNAITIARLLSALPLLWLLQRQAYGEAFWLAVVAGASDALDGFLAKHFGWRSTVGGILDPLADKVLINICFIGLWWTAHVPDWLLALIMGRDVVVLLGAWIWWRMLGAFKPAPSLLSKWTTTVQLVLAATLLAHLALAWFADVVLQTLIFACAAFTLASGMDYVLRYGRRAWRLRKEKV